MALDGLALGGLDGTLERSIAIVELFKEMIEKFALALKKEQ